MNQPWYKSISFGSLVFCFLSIVISRLLTPVDKTITWDVFGYYLYLPAYFIYHDPFFTDLSWVKHLVETYKNTDSLYQLVDLQNGKFVIMYSIGMAMLYSPFFFIADLWANFSGYPPDGLSYPYQASIAYGMMVYVGLGLQIFRKTLLLFFEDKWVALLIFLLVFATNYFQMAYGNAQLTHIPGFTALGLVIYYTYLWHENPSRKKAFGIGLGLAFCTVIRPNEMVAILIPLLWNVYSKESLKNKLNLIKQNISSVGIIVLTMVGIGFIQVLYWKTGTGQWLFYSYTNAGEGFDLLNPHLLKFLFSFKKGWFIYTPIAIFLVYSLLLFKKYKPELHPGLVVFFFISFWLISSWTCWWYAGASYSARALIPAYFALFIPFGFWIKDLFQHHKWTFYLILTFCLLINIKHTIQFKRWVIHYDRTTYSYYKANFFNLTPDTTTHHLLGFDPFTSTIEGPDNIQNYTFKELGEMPLTKTSLIQGLNGQPIDSVTEFTNGFSVRVKKLPQRDHLYLKISIDVWMDSLQTVKNPLLICTMLHHKKNYKYAGKDIGDSGFKPNQWNHLELFYLIYNPRSGNDEFITYLWNRNKANFYIKNYRVDLYEPKAEDEWP